MRVAQRVVVLILGIALTLPGYIGSAQPAAAVGGEITFGGGGWGHGIGMSQYGAYGMALDGNGYKAILEHYYTGTSIKQLSATSPGSPLLDYDEPLWVGIIQNTGSVTFIPRNGKLKICHSGGGNCPMKVQPAAGQVWKVVATGPGKCVFKKQDSEGVFKKKGKTGSCWASLSLLGNARVEFPGIGKTVGHGTFRIRPNGDTATATKFHVSFSMELDDYVLGIAEMPTSWKKAALKAQAVAARTYAAAKSHQRETIARTGKGVNPGFSTDRKTACWCHLYATTIDQAYAGWFVSQIPSWADAVTETAGEVVTHPEASAASKGVIDAYYGSSTAGVTETLAGGFGSTFSQPWLVSVDDHWATEAAVGNPYATWTAVVSESAMINALAATTWSWKVSYDYIIDVTLLNGPPESMIRVKGSVNGETVTVDVPGWWFKFGPLALRSPQLTSVSAVVTGSPHGQVWTQGGSVQSPIEAGDRFGSAMSVGDFDGDGSPDVAVSAATDGVNTVAEGGLVNVLFGDGFNLTSDDDLMLHQDQADMKQSAHPFDHFGTSTASGDFDGDGKDDLAVGVPNENVSAKADAGLIHVFSGASTGLVHDTPSPISQKTNGIPGALDGGDRFGAALAAGDFDSDGYDDLAVGSPGRDVASKAGAGMVTIIPGSADGLVPKDSYNLHQDKNGMDDTPEPNDQFGATLAVGDLDGDGNDDLIVGSPGEGLGGDSGAGVVHVFFGGSSGLKGTVSLRVHQDTKSVPGSSQPGDGFGSALSAGDMDGDGRDDLAIGVPGENIGGVSNGGRVVVVFGSGSRKVDKTRVVHQNVSGVVGSSMANDAFGHSVLVTDVLGGPRADLVVGVPHKKRSGKVAAGVIVIVPGKTGTGVNFAASRVFDQDDLPAPGTVEAGDEFGYALAMGDFDGDGHADLLIGAPGETLNGAADAGAILLAANFG